MKQLLLAFLTIFPFLSAQEYSPFGHTFFTQDDRDLFRLYSDDDNASLDENSSDSRKLSISSELSINSLESQEYDWQTIQTWDIAQCEEYGAGNLSKAAFKALRTCKPHEVKTITEGLLNILRSISPDTSDDESESYTADYNAADESDAAYLLAKSRGAHKHTEYTYHEKNSHAKKKTLTRKQKRKKYRKKEAKASYAKLKADQQVVTSKAKIDEFIALRNQEYRTRVAMPTVCHTEMNTKYGFEEPAHPHFFDLLHELENGTICASELFLELHGYNPEIVSNDNDEVEDWITIIREWDTDKQRAYGEEYLVRSAFKRLEKCPENGYSILMGLGVMLDNISQPEAFMPIAQDSDASSDESDQPMARGQFFETLKKTAATSRPDAAVSDKDDHDDAYALSKSRGARNHLVNKQHKRNQNAEKKSLVHKERKVEKVTYALLKDTQKADTKKQLLKPSEYDSLKADSNTMQELTTQFECVDVASDDDATSDDTDTQSTSSECSVASDYQFEATCRHPWCMLKLKYMIPNADISFESVIGSSSEHNHPPFSDTKSTIEKQVNYWMAGHYNSRTFFNDINSPNTFMTASVCPDFETFAAIFLDKADGTNDIPNSTWKDFASECIKKIKRSHNNEFLYEYDFRSLADEIQRNGVVLIPTKKGFHDFLWHMWNEIAWQNIREGNSDSDASDNDNFNLIQNNDNNESDVDNYDDLDSTDNN